MEQSKSSKKMTISQSQLNPKQLYDYYFENGANFDKYYPKSNLKNVLEKCECFSSQLRRQKSNLMKKKSSVRSKFFNKKK